MAPARPQLTRWLLAVAGIIGTVMSAIPAYWYADLSFVDAWLSLWAVFFLIGFALAALEAAFFHKQPPVRGLLPFAVAFAATGLMAVISAVFAAGHSHHVDLVADLLDRLSRHSFVYWAWRFFGAAGLFTFLHGTIGSATWPFIKKYYTDPAYGLNLCLPDSRVFIGLQMFRGLVAAIALFPLVSRLHGSSIVAVCVLALLLATTMGIGPLAMAQRWPAALRFIHAVEFSLFAILYSWVVLVLFAPDATPAEQALGRGTVDRAVAESNFGLSGLSAATDTSGTQASFTVP